MPTYLIVGASWGIGRSLAFKLSGTGSQVFATYNSHPVEGEKAIDYHRMDVTGENISLDFLPDAIDGLVILPRQHQPSPFERIKPQDFTSDFNLQVTGL